LVGQVLALATPQETAVAEAMGAKMELPPFLFKDFKGDFFRPATP
jgi:hypothetical protein